MSAVTHLLYLHGFRSSPQSTKARIVGAWIARQRPEVHWHCPQLPPSPRQAMQELLAATAGWPASSSAVVGSSLGGFYATAIAARRPGWRAVLLNPAVNPERGLADHVGELVAWHSEDRFEFKAEYLDELAQLKPAALSTPARVLAIIAKGDELLDWREMHARYAACRVKLIEGSDHALSDFDAHLPDLLAFLGLA